MRRLAAASWAAATLALPAGAQDEARWGPVAEEVGIGTAICADHQTVVCAVVLCRDGALSFGLIGIDPEATENAAEAAIEIDGETFRREMTGAPIKDGFVHLGTPIRVGDPLWASMRAGRAMRIADRAEAEARDYSLRGSAAELDRVAGACR
jgi:hypothetical protein